MSTLIVQIFLFRFGIPNRLILGLLSIGLTYGSGLHAQELSPKIQKLNLKSDRTGLKGGFAPHSRSGTETGGGGSEDRDVFYVVMRKVLPVLKRETYFHFHDGEKIEVVRIENALRAATIVPTYKQLYDKEMAPVDLRNDPDDLVIWFNVSAWNQWDETKKVRYALHEILGLLEIPDPLYKYSAQLERYYTEASKISPPQSEVQQEKVDRKTIFESLQAAQKNNENVVLSTQCNQYVPNFQGFCLIKSVMENGVMRQLVYLVQGTSEEFRAGSDEKIKIGVVRTIINIPPEDLSFVLAMIKYDQANFEVFNKEDCVSKGLVSRSGILDLHHCVIATFTTRD